MAKSTLGRELVQAFDADALRQIATAASEYGARCKAKAQETYRETHALGGDVRELMDDSATFVAIAWHINQLLGSN